MMHNRSIWVYNYNQTNYYINYIIFLLISNNDSKYNNSTDDLHTHKNIDSSIQKELSEKNASSGCANSR